MRHDDVRRVLLVRHPETHANASRCYLGTSDSEYTLAGAEQLTRIVAAVAEFRPQELYTSPLARCMRAARAMAVTGIEPFVIDGLAEIDFGEADGLTYDETVAFDLPVSLDGDGPVARGGERLDAFRERVIEAGESVGPGLDGRAVVITHGGVMRLLLGAWLGIPDELMWRFDIRPGCAAMLRMHDDGAVLESLQAP